MEEEKPNIDLAKHQSHQRKFPKKLIRAIIYAAVLLFLLFYGFDYLAQLQGDNKKINDFEIQIENSDSTNTLP